MDLMSRILSPSFYQRDDVVAIARELIGKVLVSRVNGNVTSGMITETEAYAGITDRASHAFGGKRSNRTKIMYEPGGVAYIYLCYGVHSLFNVVTNTRDIPHAVLIRGIIPWKGGATMAERIGKNKTDYLAGYGPGKVSRLLNIHFNFSGIELKPGYGTEPFSVWIEDHGVAILPGEIIAHKRIGVDYAGVDAALPYRFTIEKGPAQKKIAALRAAIKL
jgi:DNA-3-methyladenine glycosylase